MSQFRILSNTSELSNGQLLMLARFATPRLSVEVDLAAETGPQMAGLASCGFAGPWDTRLVTAFVSLTVPPARAYPLYRRGWGAVDSPIECALGILAHELRHLRQFDRGLAMTEADADEWAVTQLEQWRNLPGALWRGRGDEQLVRFDAQGRRNALEDIEIRAPGPARFQGGHRPLAHVGRSRQIFLAEARRLA